MIIFDEPWFIFPSNLSMIFRERSFNEWLRLFSCSGNFFQKDTFATLIRQFFCPSWLQALDFTRFQNFDLMFVYVFTESLLLLRLLEQNLLIICAKAPNYSQFLIKSWQWNYWKIKTKLSLLTLLAKVEDLKKRSQLN